MNKWMLNVWFLHNYSTSKNELLKVCHVAKFLYNLYNIIISAWIMNRAWVNILIVMGVRCTGYQWLYIRTSKAETVIDVIGYTRTSKVESLSRSQVPIIIIYTMYVHEHDCELCLNKYFNNYGKNKVERTSTVILVLQRLNVCHTAMASSYIILQGMFYHDVCTVIFAQRSIIIILLFSSIKLSHSLEKTSQCLACCSPI